MTSMESYAQPAEVASRVLRRAQVSKMARVLQNRLALANVKIKHGWENLSLDNIEPRIEVELKRKRPASSCGGPLSDTSSSRSDRFCSTSAYDSSPLTSALFSDEVSRSGSVKGPQGKRVRYQQQVQQYPASSTHNRRKTRNQTKATASWKSNYRLPESSPAYHDRYRSAHIPNLSFVSESTAVADEINTSHSEDDDEDLPTLSFQAPQLRSPPPHALPRTPSPGASRSSRLRSRPFEHNNGRIQPDNNKEEGADLLMFFAASPSPAHARRQNAPSTPPPKATPLPSSMMNTPGGSGGGFLGFGATTPGLDFNFSDFVNVTPSPAQAAWRTPGPSKTPLAAREARRRLNFDSLMPPSSNFGGSSMDGKIQGLGMELGGELVSSQ